MINKYKQVVCDVTKIILDDGVTLFPGYVEVAAGEVCQYYSDDPNNKIHKPGLLKNRVKYERMEVRGKSPLKKHLHFVDMKIYKRVINKIKGI